MHVTGQAVRHFPLRDGARIEEGSINARAGGVNVAADTGRVHAGPGTQAKPAVRARRAFARSTRQFWFAAPAAAVYSAVPLAGIVQKYTVLPPAFNVCAGFQLPMSKA
jgi:hypothetical protein